MHKTDIRLFATAASALALSSACSATRVQLTEPPSKTAPFAERVAYYEEHRPVAVRPSIVANGGLAGNAPSTSFAVLEDGTRVDNPEDLLQVVEPGSPTAMAVQREREAETEATLWHAAMFGGMSVGLGVMLGSFVPLFMALPAAAETNEPQYPGPLADLSIGMVLGGGALSLVSLVFLPAVVGSSVEATKERETAFLTLDRSLRERLDLVEYGKEQRQAKRDTPPPTLDLEPK